MTSCFRTVCFLIIIVIIESADSQVESINGSCDDDMGVGSIALCNYPWQAALYTNNVFRGSGVIIGKEHILTAASLVSDYSDAMNVNELFVIVGRKQLNSGLGDNHTVQMVLVHPGFRKSFPTPNDLAVLKLSTEIQFDETKRAIPLPTTDIFEGTLVISSGWENDFDEPVSPDLKKHNLMTTSNDNCKNFLLNHFSYEERFRNSSLLDSQVCAMSIGANWNCEFHGNIGSPLVHDGLLVGINSWGSSCYGGHPIIHSRIYKYVNWIKDCMKLH